MNARRIICCSILLFVLFIGFRPGCLMAQGLDYITLDRVFCRFPFVKIVPLEKGQAWGILYADTQGKIHLLRSTSKGWKLEWELANLGSKVRRFFHRDIDGDGNYEIIVATMDGRILVYDTVRYSNIWENLDDNFKSIASMAIENIDGDPQPEFIILADRRLFVYDAMTKSRQWVSERFFDATEIIIDNVDKDDQFEIILNTGIVIDAKFFNIELEWNKPFGERIMLFDMNNDGYPEVIGEFSDYSLRIFDIYREREVW